MKKWMITYSFLLVFLSLTLSGHTAPAKILTSYSSAKPAVKKTSQVAIENKNGGHHDCYTIINRTRFSFSITPSFTLAENNISLSVNYFFKDISAITGAKKVLKYHLLHLFPSHYFW
jgi:hypothetical protein